MSLASLLGWSDQTLTHRQYVVWLAWQELEWENPSRSDFYAMQIAAEVRRPNTRKKDVSANDMRLKFKKPARKPSALTREQLIAISKSRWCRAVGISPKS